MNLCGDRKLIITFLMANFEDLPPHFATIGHSKVPSNKEHRPCTFELNNKTT
jgi:hypothetical protein